MELSRPTVAIVDFGMGNLFSVMQAVRTAGLDAIITSDVAVVRDAAGIVLPGVGAFPTAMETLSSLGLVDVLRRKAEADTPFMGVCLGFQLLANDSDEFVPTRGLGILPAIVRRLPVRAADGDRVPNVGWRQIHQDSPHQWEGTYLSSIADGEHMYFVHSYHVIPDDPRLITAKSRHGAHEICAAIHQRNIFGCQFHPERSGSAGIKVYDRFAASVRACGQGI